MCGGVPMPCRPTSNQAEKREPTTCESAREPRAELALAATARPARGRGPNGWCRSRNETRQNRVRARRAARSQKDAVDARTQVGSALVSCAHSVPTDRGCGAASSVACTAPAAWRYCWSAATGGRRSFVKQATRRWTDEYMACLDGFEFSLEKTRNQF